MEKLVNVAKAPQDDVETFSESHGDVVTAPEFPHNDVEDNSVEKDAIMIVSNILCTRQI